MFDKMKQVYEMQRKAKEVQKVLEGVRVEKSSPGGKVKIVINGNHKVESLTIDESVLNPAQKEDLENALVKLITEAGEEARQQSALRAMELMKDVQMPGM
jgi:hypothetical protein